MQSIFYAVLFCMFISCASVRVSYDYDREADFSRYVTYNYFPDMESRLSQLDENRLTRVLDSTLQTKGYRLAENPDFFINILSNTYQNVSNGTVGLGMGGTGGNMGGGVSIGLPMGNSNSQRYIQFDFVDVEKDALFWQATAESEYFEGASPKVREERLRTIVHKVLSKFPPKKQ